MKKFLLSIISIFLLNFSIAYAYNNIPSEAKNYFDEMDNLFDQYDGVEKNFDLIIDKSNRMLEIFSENPDVVKRVYTFLGRAYISDKKFDIAKNYIEKSLQIDSQNPEVYYSLGNIERDLANYDKAIYYYEEALTLTNDNKLKSMIEGNIGVIYSNKENHSEAIKHYNASINYYQNFSSYYNRGMSFELMKDFSTAIADYNRAVTYNIIGKNEQAERDFERAKSLGINIYDN